MSQSFRNHRLFQVLSWVDGLSRGYDAPTNRQSSAENPIVDEPHRTPTVSNLAYYLLTDAKYNEDTLEDRFSSYAIRGAPTKDMFNFVKQDLTRHLTQYPGDLFTTKTVRKTADDHPSFDDGFESRQVEAKAYYLTKHGQNRLAELTDVMQFKSELVTVVKTKENTNGQITFVSKSHVLTYDAVDRIVGEISLNSIKTDSITVPDKQKLKWKTKTYGLPHVDVVDHTHDRTPIIYRD